MPKARPYETKACARCGRQFGPGRNCNGYYAWSVFDRQAGCNLACRQDGVRGDTVSRSQVPRKIVHTTPRPYETKACVECGEHFGPKNSVSKKHWKWRLYDRTSICGRAHDINSSRLGRPPRALLIEGVSLTCAEIAKIAGVRTGAIYRRFRSGLDPFTGKRKAKS